MCKTRARFFPDLCARRMHKNVDSDAVGRAYTRCLGKKRNAEMFEHLRMVCWYVRMQVHAIQCLFRFTLFNALWHMSSTPSTSLRLPSALLPVRLLVHSRLLAFATHSSRSTAKGVPCEHSVQNKSDMHVFNTLYCHHNIIIVGLRVLANRIRFSATIE